MRVIKLGIISAIAFGLLITLFSFFFPSRIRISKAIDIHAQKDSIRNLLSDVEKWNAWYPGADTMTLATVNGKKALENKRTGQVIFVRSVSDSSVVTEYSGTSLKSSTSGWNIISSSVPNTHTVQWYMDIKLKWYPWEKFSGLLMEKRYGPVMEMGLDRLKKRLENNTDSAK